MNIAILGATSLIAQELVREWVASNKYSDIHLYARNINKLKGFVNELSPRGRRLTIKNLDTFPDSIHYDVVINFIGVGDPSKTREIADSIMSVTFTYDDMVLRYLDANPLCKYIFLSSGAAYGSDFSQPAHAGKKATFEVNNLLNSEMYGLAKFVTEIKHRNLPQHSIVDVRVFNFFSRNQDLSARFFITDLLRAIKSNSECSVSPEPMVRDYLHPKDFCQIIDCIISSPYLNLAVDCYSRAPIDKNTLLIELAGRFGLQWKYNEKLDVVRSTGSKCNYYSINYELKKIGYEPRFNSVDAIISEIYAILEETTRS